jgi:hypothetical protein
MLRLEMLPARYGDALWLEYGEAAHPHVVIVDCGFKAHYRELRDRIQRLAPDQLELLVLTHVDEDHIKGAIPLLDDERIAFPDTMQCWFNGWRHLRDAKDDTLGAVQGEFFGALIERRKLAWNSCAPWGGRAIMVPAAGPLPRGKLPGGLEWTLLSPSFPKVVAMRKEWEKKVREADLEPGDTEAFLELLADRGGLHADQLKDEHDIEVLIEEEFREDDKAPNGSSIALLVEFEGRSLLLAGDAHPSVVTDSLRRLAQERQFPRIRLDALKVSHHGSRKNTSAELLKAIDCSTFLFSSSGERFGHPSPECVARIVTSRRDSTLRFNYDSDVTKRWASPGLQGKYHYQALYPEQGSRILQL